MCARTGEKMRTISRTVLTLLAVVLTLAPASTAWSRATTSAQSTSGTPTDGTALEWRNVAGAQIRETDDESPGGPGEWTYLAYDQSGHFRIEVVAANTEPAHHDGALLLATPHAGDGLDLEYGLAPYGSSPLADFTGSYDTYVRAGAAVPYSLMVTCPENAERTRQVATLSFAGTLAGMSGWQHFDVSQHGAAPWSSRDPFGGLTVGPDHPHPLADYVAACSDAFVDSYGFQLSTAGSASLVDSVVYDGTATNFRIPPLRRITGDDSGMTACQAVGEQFAPAQDPWTGTRQAAPRVTVVANERRAGDTVVAGVLANALGGRLVLVPRHYTRAHSNCLNLKPTRRAYLVGGTNAVGGDVARHLRRQGRTVVRLAAPTPSALSAVVAKAIAEHRSHDRRGTLVLASDRRLQDSLSAAAVAGSRHGALLLTHGGRLTPAVRHYLATEPGARLIAVGTDAVRASRHMAHVVRTASATPYATAVKTAARFFPHARAVVFASGSALSLAAGVYAGRAHLPVLLVTRDGLPQPVRSFVAQRAGVLRGSVVLGDDRAVSDSTYRALDARLSAG